MSWLMYGVIAAVVALAWTVLHRAQQDDKTRRKPRRITGDE
ncbi:MAG TPA: hypothetical protein VIL97_08915 [Thermoanaerobaculia bacterium]